MGVYESRASLGGTYDDQLGLKIGPIKIGTKKLEKAVKGIVKQPLKAAAKVLPFIPGGGAVVKVAQAAFPGVAKPAPKGTPKPVPTAQGPATVRIQRAISARTNRPGAKPAPTTPVVVRPQVQPTLIASSVTEAKKKADLAKKALDAAAKIREKQRKFSAKAREVADVADRAGAAVSAATTAGIAAGATGSEAAGVTTSGIVGLIKENPIPAAAVALGVAYFAFGGRRRRSS